jgi:hypothetical protein
MGRVVHGVDPGKGARLAREPAEPLCVGDRARGVRGQGECDDACPIRELALDIVVVDRQLVRRVRHDDLQPAVGCELHPRGDASVVVERRREDLASRLEVPCSGAGEGEVQRRHVHPERDLVRGRAEEARGVALRAGEDGLDRGARRVRGTEVP